MSNQVSLSLLSFTFGLGNVAVAQTAFKYAGASGGPPQDEPLYYSSFLGTPVYADISFKGQSYTDANGKTKTIQDLSIETVIITVNQHKNIVRTPVQGRDGTVKEYIGMGDFDITIQGILASSNNVYPTADVQTLQAIVNAPIPIAVTSRWLNQMGVFNIVVDSYSFPQTEGGYSQQAFSINAISDMPVQLVIQQTN
jgi:hypothetical protein